MSALRNRRGSGTCAEPGEPSTDHHTPNLRSELSVWTAVPSRLMMDLCWLVSGMIYVLLVYECHANGVSLACSSAEHSVSPAWHVALYIQHSRVSDKSRRWTAVMLLWSTRLLVYRNSQGLYVTTVWVFNHYRHQSVGKYSLLHPLTTFLRFLEV